MTKITRAEYYAALGCFLAAHHWRQKSYELENEMCEILNYEHNYAGHISDNISESDHHDPYHAFNDALAREDIKVEDDVGRDSEASETGSGEGSGSGDGSEESTTT